MYVWPNFKQGTTPSFCPQSVSQISQIISCVLHHQLNGKNPSRFLRGSRPLKGTALRAGPPFSWGVTSGGPPGGRSIIELASIYFFSKSIKKNRLPTYFCNYILYLVSKEQLIKTSLESCYKVLRHLGEYKHRSALRGTRGSACPQPHSPSQMPLSCPVAPPSQRETHKDGGGGGGGGGGVAMRARAARAPKPKSCAMSCGTPSATPSATAPRPWRARPSRVA